MGMILIFMVLLVVNKIINTDDMIKLKSSLNQSKAIFIM